MGFWSGIKYALNSTLGTTNFKSLDKIIDETDKRGKIFVIEESSPVIISSSGYISMETPLIIKFYPQISGRVKISFSANLYLATCLVTEQTQNITTNITTLRSSGGEVQTYDLNISVNKTYKFTINRQNTAYNSPQSYSFNLSACVRQYGYYDYEIN